MRTFRFVTPAVILTGALLLAGCNSTHKTSTASSNAAPAMSAMNDKCPMSGMAADPSHTATYNGQTIAFCCGKCQAKFEAMTDDQKAATVAKLAKK
jgi:outer membrane murein-binding lipoprotein Lpp